MTIEERGWFIAYDPNDGRYYLRCAKCKKSLIAYTETEQTILGGIGQPNRFRAVYRGWESTGPCTNCGTRLTVLSSDLYAEVPWRGRTIDAEPARLPLSIRVSSLTDELVKMAKAYAQEDLKRKARPDRGWRLEPEFWQWFLRSLNPASSVAFYESPEYVLSLWRQFCEESSMPVAYGNVDATRLIAYFQRAVTEAKRARLDPVLTETEWFDKWELKA